MKIEQIENSIKVDIVKSTIPILFLDSNILIEINKILQNRSKSEYKSELIEIINLLKKLSINNMIMIPNADQEWEINYGNNKSNNIDILFTLSNGNKCKSYLLIQREQKEKLFQSFLTNNNCIELNYADGFKNIDKKHSDNKIFIKGILNLFGDSVIYDLQQEKKDATSKLLSYQKTLDKKENFRDHLYKELTYEANILLPDVVRKIKQNINLESYENDFLNEFIDFTMKYKFADSYKLQLLKYREFLLSNYWFAIPFVDIERNINTYISLNGTFKDGDRQDTINASCYLPYCNYYFTDNAMCRILEELNIDKKYNVKIFSFKNIKEFLIELKKI